MKTIDPFQAEEDFLAKLREAGLVPPHGVVADGKLHRIDVEDEKPGKKSGFYVFHLDGIPAGAFGDWHQGPDAWETWCYFKQDEVPPEQWEEHKRRMDEARVARTKEEEQRRLEAKERAARIWEVAQPCDNHPYLARKGVRAYGIRQVSDGRLVIPIRDRDGEIHSVEFIDSDGAKRFLPGGRKAGCWYGIGETDKGILCVAEGYATAASIHEATGFFVAVAFDCGNMPTVARQLREEHPLAKIVVCSDDDPKPDGKNPGQEAAAKAAKMANALVAIPDMPKGGDFNDQHALKGLESVAETIQATIDADDGPITASDLFPLVLREIQARKEGRSKQSLKTGIESVDRLTGGLRRGMLTIVAGLAGSGKTAAATGIIIHVSRTTPCLLFSLEMDRIDIGARCLSQNSGVPAFHMLDEHRPFDKATWTRMMGATERMSQLALTLDDRPVSLAQIEEQTHKWYATEVRAKGHEIGLVAVDYLGLIRSDDKSESRNREVAALCQGFKRLVRKLRVAGLMLAQLNRLAARREGDPMLSDLRDSGEIENTGDLILFPLPWPRITDVDGEIIMKPPKDPNEKMVDRWICAKNKNGPTGAAAVKWIPELMQYTSLARESDSPDTRPNWQDQIDNF